MTNPNAYEAAAWMERAACGEYGAPSMFPHEGDYQGIAEALAVCRKCPVQAECLKGALERGEQWGMWGGLMPDDRKALRRKQQRNGKLVTDVPMPDAS